MCLDTYANCFNDPHTDNSCKVVMYELFVFILINSTTLINIIIQSLYRKSLFIIITCSEKFSIK